MKNIIVLGATGSVGASVLSVLRDNPDSFRIAGLAGGRAADALVSLAREFPEAAVASAAMPVPRHFASAVAASGRGGRLYTGENACLRLLDEVEADIVVLAVCGTAGLELAFKAAEKGLTILLANKEVLVSAGRLFMDAAKAGGSTVLPLDSEHAALWQCLAGTKRDEVARVAITASGGPFLRWTKEQMDCATPADALRHPVWRMGAKITVDSSTLANKALEIIEAHSLFGFSYDAIDVLVHPQSAVHAMAEMVDGSLMACIALADMRQPISYMLHYPARSANRLPVLDLAAVGRLDFEKPDLDRFPMLAAGIEAGRRGGTWPALFNAANEAAVLAFLDGRLSFPGIHRAVDYAMRGARPGDFSTLDEIAAVHAEGCCKIVEYIEKKR